MKPQADEQNAPVPDAQAGPTRDLGNEDLLDMFSIQADLLLGQAKTAEAVIFFTISEAGAFTAYLQALPITSAAAVFRPGGAEDEPALLTGAPPPNPRYGIGFTLSGLQALGRDPEGDALFKPLADGMASRAVDVLHDADPATWQISDAAGVADGVLIVTGKAAADVDGALDTLTRNAAGAGFQIVKTLRGNTRPDAAEGKEHFGFQDGVSQPAMRGCVDAAHTIPLTANGPNAPADQGLAGQDLLWPGEFVLGYSTQVGTTSKDEKGPPPALSQDWMRNGAFLVVRRLVQFVPEMHAGVAAATPADGSSPLLEAQLVGRWPSGAPILLSPAADDPALGEDKNRNNNFEFDGDREGLICPWAAHIRKAYPRNDTPGDLTGADEKAAEARTQTHRMMRRGIQFGPEVSPEEQANRATTQDRGLLFKCYVSDIERQFEFVQRSWCNEPDFAQPGSGHDPIIGQVAGGGDRDWSGAGAPGTKPSFSFAPWVKMTGGGYFFAPSLDFIDGLGEQPPAVPAPE